MVAFLKKLNESVGFTEVVDFLKGTSLRYALTHNPTIYDSLVKQFWQTATVRTLANGTQQLVASIASKEYTITKASVRSKLQLVDATGIHNLSDAEIYVGLATLGGSCGSRSYEAPLPEGNTSGSVKDSVQLKELMKVKTLETALKRKSKKVLISKSEGEESKDQGRKFHNIDDDPLVSLVRESMKEKSTDFVTPTKASREAHEEEISPTILEAAKTLRKARSMAKKINTRLDAEEDINTSREEINTSIEEAIKLQAQLDEEVAKQIHLDKMIAQRMAEEEALTEQQKKRKAQVQFEVQFYTEEDWDTIRAKLEANAELSKDVLG
ncbi:hypothetical protein Tco_0908947 [Tanacetum coccineum]|uniref:Xylulose kinase-1 n=1 Tax=Tanacetum coccineum TaxID=301880 RepID=A0ABQ5CQN8_9ASTR